ncbi:hypothetical protein BZK31_04165 [Pseudomonas floridensis]|uniref:Lipoprotein n=2 Tax=Pseudomonas floridensis TaxID=1958950 RepID=A0A1X0NB83_9PSED|nr:hypothetical protein BZK31_04165 [Pseudomonas floridensis]
MRRTAVLLLSALILSGCGKPKLDGSSNEALQQSISKVVAGMSEEEKNQFKEDLQVVAMTNLDLRAVFTGQSSTDLAKQNMLTSLDGKTAAEVGVEAKRILVERANREHEQAVSEINALMEKQKNAQIAKNHLSKFAVPKSAFYMKKDKYYVKPYIDLSVVNGTDQVISRVYFIGTIATPGRPVPWFSERFNYEISGGLQPGESADWTLEMNMFSDWAKIQAPAGAFFSVEAYRIDGADKQPIYNAAGLTEKERNRLQELRTKFAAK